MLDYIAIFKNLNRKKIKYVVAGGIAVNLHGIPRMTYDVDLLLDPEDRNLMKFVQLLKGWGFKPKVPVNIEDFSKRHKRADWIKNKNIKAFSFVNPKWAMSEIDVIIDTPVDYKKALKNVSHIKIQRISVPVVSIKDLIKMKKVSGRKQDIADIRYLRKVINEKK